MSYKRINELVTEYLNDDEAGNEKEIIRNNALDRLANLLDASDICEANKLTLEVEFSVESGMGLTKTVDDYVVYINKLLVRILK